MITPQLVLVALCWLWWEGIISHSTSYFSVSVGSVTLLLCCGRRYNYFIYISWLYNRSMLVCMICMCCLLQLPLPESFTGRWCHSVSTFQLGPHCVWLVVFGGLRTLSDRELACTAIAELGQQYDIVVLCVQLVIAQTHTDNGTGRLQTTVFLSFQSREEMASGMWGW